MERTGLMKKEYPTTGVGDGGVMITASPKPPPNAPTYPSDPTIGGSQNLLGGKKISGDSKGKDPKGDYKGKGHK